MYLRDLPHSSFAPEETSLNASNIGNLRQLWKMTAGAQISTAPTVLEGILYFGDWGGTFYAVDGASGQVIWKTYVGVSPTPDDPTCQPGTGVTGQSVVTGDRVFVPGGDSAVYALDRASGAVVWRQAVADPQSGSQLWSSLVLSGNSLYLGIASLGDCPRVRGAVARIPLDNPAQTVIRYLVPEGVQGAGVWSTPAVDEQAGLIYVTTGDADVQSAESGYWGSAMLSLDAATLEIKSHFFLPVPDGEPDVDFGTSPTLFQTPDGAAFVAASGKDGKMYVLNRGDLSLAWQARLAQDCIEPQVGCGALSTPAFDGSVLYAGAGGSPGSVYAFNPFTQGMLWFYPARGTVIAPVTVVPGLVFVPSLGGLAVLDSSTGRELWLDTTGPLVSQAVISNGILFCTYYNGDVVAWGPETMRSSNHRVVRR